MKSWLIVGGSGSGKSWFFKQRLKEESPNRPIFLIGGDYQRDFPEFSMTLLPSLLELEKHPENCIVLLDDLFSIEKKEHPIIRSLLNYSKRHHNVSIYVACHSLHFSGTLGILSAFDRVVLSHTATKKDLELILKAGRVKNEDLARLQFEGLKQYVYWVCGVDKGGETHLVTADLVPIQSEGSEMGRARLIQNVMTTLGAFPTILPATKAFFLFLLQNMDASRIHPTDLSLPFQNTLKKEPIRVSIIDFLVNSQLPHENPSLPSIAFLYHLRKKMELPRSLIRNLHMRQHLTNWNNEEGPVHTTTASKQRDRNAADDISDGTDADTDTTETESTDVDVNTYYSDE